MAKDRKIVLVTGASSGIGEYIARLLHENGYKVYGTSRKNAAAPFEMLKMDVDSDESVSAAVGALLEREGRLDVAVNCAGFGIAGPVEDTSIEEAKAQFETNFFGVMRVCRAVLPGMRERGAGMIINVSSLGGLVSAPFHGLYCASKFAVEGLTEALRMEVAGFGVKVVLVEPGDFKTNFTDRRIVTEGARKNPAYRETFEKSLKAMEENERKGPEPVMVAKLVMKIIETPEPGLRYPAAAGVQRLVPALKKILPEKIFLKEIMKQFGLK